ncbi:hypothetical protein SAMN05216338_1018105 [Bradyrhizobium sp. Rc2d]|nr:hypothetical protein SAMN05216338_1018105 [Bradyrhizobium sp. Rc2d]
MVQAASRRCESVTFVEVSPNLSLEVHHALQAILESFSPGSVEARSQKRPRIIDARTNLRALLSGFVNFVIDRYTGGKP